MLQGDYPTMSIYYPCINLLLKSMHPSQSVFVKLLNDESGIMIGHDELNSFAKEVRESLLSDLETNIDTKFTVSQKELMGISSFFDPRWKTLSFLEGRQYELVAMLQGHMDSTLEVTESSRAVRMVVEGYPPDESLQWDETTHIISLWVEVANSD